MRAVEQAIEVLTAERSKIDAALVALGHLNNFADTNVITRPVIERRARARRAKPRRRILSPEAKANIIAAQRKRWAKWRRSNGKKAA